MGSKMRGIDSHCSNMVLNSQRRRETAENVTARPDERNFSLMIGMDIKRYSDTLNRMVPPFLLFKRPTDLEAHTFHTYISEEKDGNTRLRIALATPERSTVTGMAVNITKCMPINMNNKLHRVTYLTGQRIEEMLKYGTYLNPGLRKACEQIYRSCDIFSSSGRPKHSK